MKTKYKIKCAVYLREFLDIIGKINYLKKFSKASLKRYQRACRKTDKYKAYQKAYRIKNKYHKETENIMNFKERK